MKTSVNLGIVHDGKTWVGLVHNDLTYLHASGKVPGHVSRVDLSAAQEASVRQAVTDQDAEALLVTVAGITCPW